MKDFISRNDPKSRKGFCFQDSVYLFLRTKQELLYCLMVLDEFRLNDVNDRRGISESRNHSERIKFSWA